MVCSKCGKDNSESAKFCRFCGNSFVISDSEKHQKTEFEMKKKKPIFLWVGIVAVIVLSVTAVLVFSISRGADKEAYGEKIDLGRKYLLDMNYEQAILAFEDAIKIDPKKKDAYLELAAIYEKEGKLDEAISILEKAEKNIENENDKGKIIEIRRKIENEKKEATPNTSNYTDETIDSSNQNDYEDIVKQSERDDDSGILLDNDSDKSLDSGKNDTVLYNNIDFVEKKVSYKVEAKRSGDDDIIGVSRAEGRYYILEGDSPQIEEINRQLKEDAERAIYTIPDDFNGVGYPLTLSYELYDCPKDTDPYSLVDSIYYYVYNIKRIDKYIAMDVAEGSYVGEKDYSLMFSLDTGEQIVSITEVSEADTLDEVYEQVVDVLKEKGYSDYDVESVIWSLEDFIKYDEGYNTWWSMTETNDIMIRIGYYSELMTDVVIPSKFNSKGDNSKKDIPELIKNANIGDIVTFGNYEQDGNLNNGTESIEWIVLFKDSKKVLLLSKYALDYQTICEDEDTIDFVTWENCSLRGWLNKDFYKKAFNKKERELLIKTTIKDNGDLLLGTGKGNDTKDWVFLLSTDDVKNTKYGFSASFVNDDEYRRCAPTVYAKNRGISTLDEGYSEWRDYATNDGEPTCWWGLRSFDEDGKTAAVVSNVGRVSVFIWVGQKIPVRPAIYLSLE